MTHKEALNHAIEMRKKSLAMDVSGHDRFSSVENRTDAQDKILSVLSESIKSNREALEQLEAEYQKAYGDDSSGERGAQ